MARTNFIQNMMKQYGENWIVALKPDDIQRFGKRIFKEMVKNQIDYQKEGNYFLDGKFLDNLIISARNELEVNTLYCNALTFYMQYNTIEPMVSVKLTHLQSLCYIYKVILDKLNMVKNTSNIGWLADTSALLYNYRNHLN